MGNLEETYKAIAQLLELGLPLTKQQLEMVKEAEEDYITQKVIPEITRILPQILNPLKCKFSFKADYSPETGLKVKWTGDKQVKTDYRNVITKTDDDIENVSEDEADHEDFVFSHVVDWSPFEYGLVIDRKYHEQVFGFVGKYLERGDKVSVKLIFNGEEYKARITNADAVGRKGDMIRLLYPKTEHIGLAFAKALPSLYSHIKSYKETYGGRSRCPIPESMVFYLHFYKTTEANTFIVKINQQYYE